MNLQKLIRDVSGHMSYVSVHVVPNMGTVCIYDHTGTNEDIFLQGDEGYAFISERDRIWNETGNLDKETIELYLAARYVENLWN